MRACAMPRMDFWRPTTLENFAPVPKCSSVSRNASPISDRPVGVGIEPARAVDRQLRLAALVRGLGGQVLEQILPGELVGGRRRRVGMALAKAAIVFLQPVTVLLLQHLAGDGVVDALEKCRHARHAFTVAASSPSLAISAM
ncbi:MAG: hypothetical protein E5Y50_33125 [Mesorhizobium sp.]|nr:MAG: hypothetical protein E5Y50_33125 [Mesorhizobium sp.]